MHSLEGVEIDQSRQMNRYTYQTEVERHLCGVEMAYQVTGAEFLLLEASDCRAVWMLEVSGTGRAFVQQLDGLVLLTLLFLCTK